MLEVILITVTVSFLDFLHILDNEHLFTFTPQLNYAHSNFDIRSILTSAC